MHERGRVLIAGESWVTHSTHQKGFDSFVEWAGYPRLWQQLVGWAAAG